MDDPLVSYLHDASKHNSEFLSDLAKTGVDIYKNILDLTESALPLFKKNIAESNHVEDPEGLYFIRFYMPLSQGLLIDALLGNLSVCYFELRAMVEGLIICYEIKKRSWPPGTTADQKFLEAAPKINPTNTAKEVDKKVGSVNGRMSLETLWRNLSDIHHARGMVEEFIDAMNSGHVQPGALSVPNKYEPKDIDDLKTLESYINDVRKWIVVVLDK